MKPVFLDTAGVLAVLDERDQWHDAAEAAYARLLNDGADFLTTSFVLAECANAAARRPFRGAVVDLREALASEGAIVDPLAVEMEEAWDLYSAGHVGDAGVADHLSFMVMRRYGLQQAFTNDWHFRTAGFQPLF